MFRGVVPDCSPPGPCRHSVSVKSKSMLVLRTRWAICRVTISKFSLGRMTTRIVGPTKLVMTRPDLSLHQALKVLLPFKRRLVRERDSRWRRPRQTSCRGPPGRRGRTSTTGG